MSQRGLAVTRILVHEAGRAIRATLVLWIITALIYPLGMITFGQLVLPAQANGSLITRNGEYTTKNSEVVGSTLIGQPFISFSYFNSRPSSTNYSTADPKKDDAGVLKTGVSGASNLGATNPALLDRIQDKTDGLPRLLRLGIQPTADLLYTSGSGIDPHITPEAATAQIARVVKARRLQTDQVQDLINKNTDGRFLGIFGEPGVNVLKINLALDALKPLVK